MTGRSIDTTSDDPPKIGIDYLKKGMWKYPEDIIQDYVAMNLKWWEEVLILH